MAIVRWPNSIHVFGHHIPRYFKTIDNSVCAHIIRQFSGGRNPLQFHRLRRFRLSEFRRVPGGGLRHVSGTIPATIAMTRKSKAATEPWTHIDASVGITGLEKKRSIWEGFAKAVGQRQKKETGRRGEPWTI